MAVKSGKTTEARLAAAEHERQVLLLRIRGLAFDAIGKQLGMTKQGGAPALQGGAQADAEGRRRADAKTRGRGHC